jgi:hypothetical protein
LLQTMPSILSTYSKQRAKSWIKWSKATGMETLHAIQLGSVTLKQLVSLSTATQAPYAFTTNISMFLTDFCVSFSTRFLSKWGITSIARIYTIYDIGIQMQ